MNIAIIGAGPIGGYAGYLLAKAGHTVTLYENHPQVGCPIQCTGILTADFDEFLKESGLTMSSMDAYLVNVIDTVEVYTPKGQLAVKDKNYIVDRTRFDRFFVNLAVQEGAKLFVNHSFSGKNGLGIVIRDSTGKVDKTIQPDIIIGADGPLSPTAKAFGFYHPERINFYGVQATVEGNFESHTIKTYFGTTVCPGLFAWIVPESATIARVGLATTKNSKHYFDQFMREHKFVAKEIQAGAIPIYHPQQKLQQGNCYLAGDAAGYVKATTLGGLVPGLQQAQILAKCINNDIDNSGNKDKGIGKSYEQELAPVRRKMWLHWQLYKLFQKFSDEDWDRLVKYIENSGVTKVLEQHTRDNPWPIVVKALVKEPRLLGFLRYLW
ncbi:MAG: NAD(P)/FAD-dependent oxidoreductase [Nanoarchaeota archaeon]